MNGNERDDEMYQLSVILASQCVCVKDRNRGREDMMAKIINRD